MDRKPDIPQKMDSTLVETVSGHASVFSDVGDLGCNNKFITRILEAFKQRGRPLEEPIVVLPQYSFEFAMKFSFPQHLYFKRPLLRCGSGRKARIASPKLSDNRPFGHIKN